MINKGYGWRCSFRGAYNWCTKEDNCKKKNHGGSMVACFMNSGDDPTQLQWRSLINCIIIDNDETNVIVLFVIILMKVRSLTTTLRKRSSCAWIIQMNLLSFRHYGYRPQPHCTTMKEVNKGTYMEERQKDREWERKRYGRLVTGDGKQFCKHMICNFNFPGSEPVFMFWCIFFLPKWEWEK